MSLNIEYRPESFEEVFGNEELVEALENMVKRKKPRSSYFFTGVPGSGKTTIARVLKNELQVHDNDFHEFDAATTRGIDTIRSIRSEAQSKALFGKRKMYLLDECHQNTGAAAESLLKFLEDPPGHVYIAMCTSEPGRINANTLSAFRRRCFCGELKRISPPEITEYLKAICRSEERTVSNKLLRKISLNCNGSIGHALSMLDTVFTTEGKDDLALLDTIYFSDETLKPLITTLIDERESGPAKWKRISKFLKSFEGNPEEARRSIANYLAKVLQNKDINKGQRLAQIAVVFTESFYDAGMLGLTLACYQACLDSDVPI
ncbi:MAG: AAA family ATPase [Halobacteriota archaeon]|nr:AAA family ATPase [Halobacteriota archaeon]